MSFLPETFVPGFHNEEDVKKMKYFKLGDTGLSVSQLGLGTAGFCYLFGDYTFEECKATVVSALKSGINYIDTAHWYGHGVSEEILGKVLREIPRKAYYIATKIARYEKDPKLRFDFSAEKTRESVDISIRRLGVDYIDIIQIHDVDFAPSTKIVLEETLPTLKEAVDQGKAKFIGITGYPLSILKDIIKNSAVKIDTVLNYARFSLVDNALKEYLPFFESKHLGIINGAVHCMGLLSSVGPQDWHPAPQNIKDVCSKAREYCKEKGVELGRLALYYSIQQKQSQGPHTNLVGINTRKLLAINLDVVQNGLSKNELEALEHVKKLFTKLPSNSNWEFIENAEYWKAIKE